LKASGPAARVAGLAGKIVTFEFLAEEIEFPFKKRGQFVVRCGENDLPIIGDDHVPKVIKE
jgi:hypothetical protein